MHPPPFRLELNCCRDQSVRPVRLTLRDHGDRTFAAVPEMPEPPPQSICALATVSSRWALRRIGRSSWCRCLTSLARTRIPIPPAGRLADEKGCPASGENGGSKFRTTFRVTIEAYPRSLDFARTSRPALVNLIDHRLLKQHRSSAGSSVAPWVANPGRRSRNSL